MTENEQNVPYNLNDFIDSIEYSNNEKDAIKGKISEEVNEENYSFIKDYQIVHLSNWLSKLNNVKNVFVLGHSLGRVDKDYFNKKLPKANWIVSFYKSPNGVKENAAKLSFYSKINLVDFNDMVKIKSRSTNKK